MHELVLYTTSIVTLIFLKIGYIGVFLLMSISSTFIPLPSEIILAPAGYMVSLGHMSYWTVILMGLLGSMVGSYINYYIGEKLGRKFLLKYGKYFGFSTSKFEFMERIFLEYGSISTFVGRVIPLVRNYISIPAGIVRMNKVKFFIYTLLGSLIWVIFLTTIGFYVGNNMTLVTQYVHHFFPYILIALIIVFILYVIVHKKRKKESHGKKN